MGIALWCIRLIHSSFYAVLGAEFQLWTYFVVNFSCTYLSHIHCMSAPAPFSMRMKKLGSPFSDNTNSDHKCTHYSANCNFIM